MEKAWKKSGILIYSLNQPVFPEHLLYVRLCYGDEDTAKNKTDSPLPP